MDLDKHHPNLIHHLSDHFKKSGASLAELLLAKAGLDNTSILSQLQSQTDGLSEEEASTRLSQYGTNSIAREKRILLPRRLWNNISNPLVLLLLALGVVSFFTGDVRATLVILIMVVLGVALRFFQEMRADNAAAKLKAMVRNTATVLRDGVEKEIPLKSIVPGDIVHLAAGDMVPADVKLLSAKDLFLNQSALTGESRPVEKKAELPSLTIKNPLELPNICFLGSNVESGCGTAIVVHTGDQTYFGSLAASIVGQRILTSFDKGVNNFTWLMIKFILVMVPIVFLLNVLTKHDWFEAFLFALAVAVGLTPEMLPMIVTVNLSKGALAMARKKVIVKRLNAIQNFGAMDVLCTDKTGTITKGKIVLEKHLDVNGIPNEKVLHYGYLNSYNHTGLKNLLDEAILDHEDLEERLKAKEKYRKIDEIPFDFVRRRMSVVVQDSAGINTLICKGAVDEIIQHCTRVSINDVITDMLPEHANNSRKIAADLNAEGYRVIALGYKETPAASDKGNYSIEDESGLILLGFLAFLDPPKDSAAETLQRLRAHNINVKILTGDNEIVTSYICNKVGISVANLLHGAEIESMSDTELAAAVTTTDVFVRLAPAHKERIIRALQAKGHVTGFLGDGINDAPALKAADVGISVDSAVDIAKESSDMILLETNLLLLEQGVIEGRKVFGNIIKYVKMAASSNFGNMFSVIGASIFLPFLPMLPIQVLTNNLLYDFSQTAIPTDEVDADWLAKPRQWTIGNLRRFILYIGPISSIFDYITFFLLLYVFHCWNNPTMFHTGWFVESIFTQTLIIHVIRTNKIPFIQSRASWMLILTSLIIVAIGAWLTVSPFAASLGFVALPKLFWLFLVIILFAYVVLTQYVKTWFIRKFGD